MGWLLLVLLPVAAFAVLDLICRGELPGWLKRSPRPRPPSTDVFDTLWVQSRLSAVADEIVRLECDEEVFARAMRLRATRLAYDNLLAEACRLAGVGLDSVGVAEADAGKPRGAALARLADEPLVSLRISDSARTTAELELASRGWSW